MTLFCWLPGALARNLRSVFGVSIVAVERDSAPTAIVVTLGMFQPSARPPSGPVVPHRVAHLRVEEAKEQGHQESLDTSSNKNPFSMNQRFKDAPQVERRMEMIGYMYAIVYEAIPFPDCKGRWLLNGLLID